MTEPMQAEQHTHEADEIRSEISDCSICNRRLFNSWIRNIEVNPKYPTIDEYVLYRGLDDTIGWRLPQESMIYLLNQALTTIDRLRRAIEEASAERHPVVVDNAEAAHLSD